MIGASTTERMFTMKVKRMVNIGIFAALTAVCAQISFVIPFTTIPFSMVILAVFLCGAILSPLDAFLAQAAYILVGAIGLPVYAQFSGGPGVLFGMTGGYIFAYLAMTPVVALFAKHLKNHLYPALLAGMTVALLICYTVGTVWYVIITQANFITGLSLCVVPFVVPDVIKIIVAASLALALRKALTKARLYEAA